MCVGFDQPDSYESTNQGVFGLINSLAYLTSQREAVKVLHMAGYPFLDSFGNFYAPVNIRFQKTL